MPKFLIGGIVLLLLLGAGYGIATIQAARAIPWDCSDWQAFAHDDRTTAILESLAENRGKTLYCGVDQSDTFTKAETWEAGKDRNERDDTVYFGERGIFRGFIAAQEGYLTDGESGVTGVSIDRIFEFPREERRRTKRVKRMDIANDAAQWPINAWNSCEQVGGLICGDPGRDSNVHSTANPAIVQARRRLVGGSAREIDWDTQEIFTYLLGPPKVRTATGNSASPTTDQWQEMAETAAKSACRAQGYPQVTNVAFHAGHNGNNGAVTTAEYVGNGLGLLLSENRATNPGQHIYRMRQSRTWTATCKKVIRRTRK